MEKKQIKAIMDFYEYLVEYSDYEWIKWTNKKFTVKRANIFFIGIMVDQIQNSDRAWRGAAYFVENYFNNTDNFWKEILSSDIEKITKICQKGYEGKSFAIPFLHNTFPNYLKSAANKIVNKYGADVRNIWRNIGPENVNIIYERFREFDGIDELAKMAQFMLVRNYGVAGGIESKKLLSIKPDILVQRVMFRMGISAKESINEVIKIVNQLDLISPADFDASLWVIGREYCKKNNPKCLECPVKTVCNYFNPPPDDIDGYCVKCRKKVTIKNPKKVILKNKKPAIKGHCSFCETEVYRMISNKK